VNKLATGRLGERLAGIYLRRSGYKIIRTNYWKPYGEIDIVARDKNGALVFVEVKTMWVGYLNPEEHLTKTKLAKLKRMGLAYLKAFPNELKEPVGFRIDLLAITLKSKPRFFLLTDIDKYCDINHYQNIF